MILEFIIETRDLTFRYDGSGSPSLDGVTLGISKGVKTVILGANGAGKSTLFYQFNAVFRPEKGQVLFGGEPVLYRRKGIRRLRTRIAVVLQNPDDQVFGQTVEADVAYGPTNLGLSKEEVFRRVDEALFQTGMDDLREKNVLQLSYGQRKRLALAGALAMRPEVLVMDEPTAGLDPQMAIEVMELAEQLHNRGTDVIISTHDVDLAYSWADDIHVLRKGKVIYSGDPEGFYSDPWLVYSAGVMQPSMYLMNKGLSVLKEIPLEPYPRTEPELISKMTPGHSSRLYVFPVSEGMELDDEAVAEAMGGNRVTIGLYGMETRHRAYSVGLRADFVFNGLDLCLEQCLRGFDTLLICDEDCLGVIRSRVESLRYFGSTVDIQVVGRS